MRGFWNRVIEPWSPLPTAPALAFDDPVVAERNVSALQARPRVKTAAIYRADGVLFASYVREGEPPPPSRVPLFTGTRVSGEQVEIAQPVVRNGESLGAIYLVARYDVAGRIKTYLEIFAVVMLLSLAVSYAFSRGLQQVITEPLEAITSVARNIVNRRDYSLRAQKTTDDEIGVVVTAFNSMMHAVKLLTAPAADEHQQVFAREIIGRQVLRMALLLDDLLDVSRITRGKLDLKREVVDLRTIVDAAVETTRPMIESKQQQLAIELPAEPLRLFVDALRLSQSLSNLLTNATKYTDAKGQIGLKVTLTPNELAMTVKDTGIGIEPRTIPTLFEMFSQVDSAIDRAEGGLGIGLALVKGLVGLHGGSVEGESAGMGHGSEFTIHLPRTLVVEQDPVAEPVELIESVRPVVRAKILVADDNRDAADSMALILEFGGYNLTVAHSGSEALEKARASMPDAMILDIGMPDMTGYEVARRVRAEPWGERIFMLAITGWGQQEDKERAMAAGFDQHMTKPVDADAVEQRLRAFLDSRHRN